MGCRGPQGGHLLHAARLRVLRQGQRRQRHRSQEVQAEPVLQPVQEGRGPAGDGAGGRGAVPADGRHHQGRLVRGRRGHHRQAVQPVVSQIQQGQVSKIICGEQGQDGDDDAHLRLLSQQDLRRGLRPAHGQGQLRDARRAGENDRTSERTARAGQAPHMVGNGEVGTHVRMLHRTHPGLIRPLSPPVQQVLVREVCLCRGHPRRNAYHQVHRAQGKDEVHNPVRRSTGRDMQGVRPRHPREMCAQVRVKEEDRHSQTRPTSQAKNGDTGILGTNY